MPPKWFRSNSKCLPSRRCCIRMDAKEEALSLLNKMWVKLQNLPNADAVDLGAFFIILTFMCEFLLHCCRVPVWRGLGSWRCVGFFSVMVLLMAVLTCVSCCCRRKTKMKDTGIWNAPQGYLQGHAENVLQHICIWIMTAPTGCLQRINAGPTLEQQKHLICSAKTPEEICFVSDGRDTYPFNYSWWNMGIWTLWTGTIIVTTIVSCRLAFNGFLISVWINVYISISSTDN